MTIQDKAFLLSCGLKVGRTKIKTIGYEFNKDPSLNFYAEPNAVVGDHVTYSLDVDNSTTGILLKKESEYYIALANGRIHELDTSYNNYDIQSLKVLSAEAYTICVEYNFAMQPFPKLIKKEIPSHIDGTIFSVTKDSRFLKRAYQKITPQSPTVDDYGFEFPNLDNPVLTVNTSNGMFYNDSVHLVNIDTHRKYLRVDNSYQLDSDCYMLLNDFDYITFKQFYKL